MMIMMLMMALTVDGGGCLVCVCVICYECRKMCMLILIFPYNLEKKRNTCFFLSHFLRLFPCCLFGALDFGTVTTKYYFQ